LELTAETGEREYACDGADGGQQHTGSSFPQGRPSGPGGKSSRSLWPSGTAAQHRYEAPTGLQAENVEAGVLLNWETLEVEAGSVTGYRSLTRQPEFGEAFYTLVDDTGTTGTSYGPQRRRGGYRARLPGPGAARRRGERLFRNRVGGDADGSTNRAVLGTVSATDSEVARLACGIEEGNATGLFEIDSGCGELFYVGTGEDFESGTSSYDRTVHASDGRQNVQSRVNVKVTNVVNRRNWPSRWLTIPTPSG